MTEFIAFLASFLSVQEDSLTKDTHFVNDLGLDSLDAIDLVTAIESKYDIEVDDADIDSIKTVGDALTYIETKQNKEKTMAKRITITEDEMAHRVNKVAKTLGIDISIENTGKLLDIFEDETKKAVVEENADVKMRHFGTFTVAHFKARPRYNPATQKTEQFPAVNKAKFEGSDEFNNALNETV
jgi:acyl carrier protein